jgi:hypothetical protein
LLEVEQMLRSIDKAIFYAGSIVGKIGGLFSKMPGYENIKPQIIGTTKVLQHMGDSALLTGPLLSQLKAVKSMPSASALQGQRSAAAAGHTSMEFSMHLRI